ncbi:MAG: glycosyltransferase family 2 protein, partial [Candidatus Baltobacteraceae bacterium]
MDYSIIIPVFNKAGLTRNCLAKLRPTLEGAGVGEIIVIDNGSTDETARMLDEFPWIRRVRNERNLGFAGANNQGARLARGRLLVLLNNDIEPHPNWLKAMVAGAAPDVGAVGARLLFPNGTLQHAGVVLAPLRFGSGGFIALHDLYGAAGNHPGALVRSDYQVVTGACMLTPRELYLDLGGLDEGFWNGYEDVDYCLKVRAQGLRVVYEPDAVLTHFESQSGSQRFRRASANIERLGARWAGKVVYDVATHYLPRGMVRREARLSRGAHTMISVAVPKTTIVVHGDRARYDDPVWMNALRSTIAPVERVVWAGKDEAVAAARRETELRSDRYVAFVDSRAALDAGWLDELVRQVEYGLNTVAATGAPELPRSEDVCSVAADARCTLLSMRHFPQHMRLDSFGSLDGALADFTLRAIPLRLGTRGVARDLGSLPEVADDKSFEAKYGEPISAAITADLAKAERILRDSPKRTRGLVSIVMLSWNAPQFTKMALESIRAYTSSPYEVIIVDNGSREDTTGWLHSLDDVTVIYNAANRGYAGGNNQGLAAAKGDYVVLLNNDVVVTEGWLDGLLDPFDRIPGLGVSAPRSNIVAGHQVIVDAAYQDMAAMHLYAAQRRTRYRRHGYVTDRAIGLCLCIDRRVIDEVGGIDETFGVGNFEDDDFCLRVRGARYRIYVCDDVFIHHFGSQTFAANKIDWHQTMRENWTKFAAKWGLPPEYPESGYQSGAAILRGFDRSAHYVPLPTPAAEIGEPVDVRTGYSVAFVAAVRDEHDWNEIGSFVRRYLSAFTAADDTLLAIAATGELAAALLGQRVEAAIAKLGVLPEAAADIEISDEPDAQGWAATLSA